MSKAVLISIRPEWADRICYCGKTMEIRKTRPTIQPPFKCYINKTGKETEPKLWRNLSVTKSYILPTWELAKMILDLQWKIATDCFCRALFGKFVGTAC